MVNELQICEYLVGNNYRIEMLVLIRGAWGDVMPDARVMGRIGWVGEATLIGRIIVGFSNAGKGPH